MQELDETLSDLQHSIQLIKNEIKTHSKDTMDLHQQHKQNFIGLKGSIEEMKQKNAGHMDSHNNHDQEIVNTIQRLNETVQELQERIANQTLGTQSPNDLSNEIDNLKQEIDSIRHQKSNEIGHIKQEIDSIRHQNSNEIGHIKQEIDSIRHQNSIIVYGILCLCLVSIVLFRYKKYKKDSKKKFCSVKYSPGQEKLNNVVVDEKC